MRIPQPDDNSERPYDDIISRIVEYTYEYEVKSEAAWARSKIALIDSLGVAIESLAQSKECAQLIQPILPGAASIPGGFRLPGTSYSLDALQGAFCMGTMIRYLDHNDAFPGAEWGHPSDNLGALLVVADILTRDALARGREDETITMRQLLLALIKAYEIQGCFQIKNAFNRVGLDHTILVKIASTAVVSWMMGLPREQARAALSHAWADGHPLRVFRQSPNAGPPRYQDDVDGRPLFQVLNKDQEFRLPRPFQSWVVENVIFKVLTAEGHGLTAVEATMAASKELQARGLEPMRDIKSIHVRTQEAAMIIINKTGSLHNPADRDHCLRYMMAVVLLKNGAEIETADYQDDSPWALDERVEALRSVITMEEDTQFTRDYHNPEIRSCGSSIEVSLKDGTSISTRQDFPLGHIVRNEETIPRILQKAVRNLELKFSQAEVARIMATLERPDFGNLPTSMFIDMFRK
ncbi:putative SpoL [Seiridium unicorne]|uniref:SpoL n=1 Tax=Seiridium unicorne TaxID=138068 RepID=A0ABR2VBK7_9PEZI